MSENRLVVPPPTGTGYTVLTCAFSKHRLCTRHCNKGRVVVGTAHTSGSDPASSPQPLLFACRDPVSLSFLIGPLVITTSPSRDCSGRALKEARFRTRVWQAGSTCGRRRRQQPRLLTGSPSRGGLDPRHSQVSTGGGWPPSLVQRDAEVQQRLPGCPSLDGAR